MEAVFGAVFLDGGFDAARRTIGVVYADLLRDVDPSTLGKDPKTRLQEWLQSQRLPVPEYAIVAHDRRSPRAAVRRRMQDRRRSSIVALGTGSSRRAAEQDAALQALRRGESGQSAPSA